MAYYDHYTIRPRNGLGVRAKLRQARKIYELGLPRTNDGRKTILEIGPGDGYIADLSVANKHEYYAVEASPTIAESLRARGYRVHQGFVPPLPPEPRTVDACYVLHVIEHLQNMQAAIDFVSAIRDRLTPDGTITIATPDLMRWKNHFYDTDYTHVLPFTFRRLRQLFNAVGMKISHEQLYVGPVFGYAGVPLAALASLLFTPTVDDFFRKVLPGDIASRAFFTILPNLLVVARK